MFIMVHNLELHEKFSKTSIIGNTINTKTQAYVIATIRLFLAFI